MNESLFNHVDQSILKFRHIAKIKLRKLLDDQGFIEIDPPYLLQSNTPDPYIDPLVVKRLLGPDLQLHTSPEIWLKKALSMGMPTIYHLGKVFRDDPITDRHSIEFTMLEWYRARASLDDLIVDCQEIFQTIWAVAKDHALARPFKQIAFIETDVDSLFWEYARIDLPSFLKQDADGDAQALQRHLIVKKGDYLPKDASFCDAFFHVMLKYVEPFLPKDNPIVVKRWPHQLAALAKSSPDNHHYCERFEIYFQGLEIANAYQECCDPNVLRTRFLKENCDRQQLGKPTFTIDEAFLENIAQMPESAGIALGFDRLLLSLVDRQKISQVIFGCQKL